MTHHKVANSLSNLLCASASPTRFLDERRMRAAYVDPFAARSVSGVSSQFRWTTVFLRSSECLLAIRGRPIVANDHQFD
jgi:hypothetical protein